MNRGPPREQPRVRARDEAGGASANRREQPRPQPVNVVHVGESDDDDVCVNDVSSDASSDIAIVRTTTTTNGVAFNRRHPGALPSHQPSPTATSEAPKARTVVHSVPPCARVDGLPLGVRIPLDAMDPSRGWIIRGRLPADSGLALAQPDGAPLRLLLSLRPAELGKIVMFGKPTDTPRYHQALGRDYVFTGVRHPASDYPPCVAELMTWANARSHEWQPTETTTAADATTTTTPRFNSGLVNWYMDGRQYMGPHSDDERSLHPQSPIFSFTVGQTRVFRIRDGRTGKPVRDMDLRSGEWLVMGGAMQANYKHEVVKVAGAKGAAMGPRVNITFRQMT